MQKIAHRVFACRLFLKLVHIYRDKPACARISKSNAPKLIIVIPVLEQLIDIMSTSLIGFDLRIIKVKCRQLPYHECLYVCKISPGRYLIGFCGYRHLFPLIVKPLHQHKYILTEIETLLPEPALHHIAVALCQLHLATTLAPVKKRHFEPELNHLIVF